MTASAKHEARALLRAHLAAATRYRHQTSGCAVCSRIQRLAMEPSAFPPVPEGAEATVTVRLPAATARRDTEGDGAAAAV